MGQVLPGDRPCGPASLLFRFFFPVVFFSHDRPVLLFAPFFYQGEEDGGG